MARGVENLRPWKPGQSGNPGGRPKTLLAAVRRVVGDDGQKLVEAWAVIAFGDRRQIVQMFGCGTRVTAKDRLDAIEALADRGFGKAIQAIRVGQDEDAAPFTFTLKLSDNGHGPKP